MGLLGTVVRINQATSPPTMQAANLTNVALFVNGSRGPQGVVVPVTSFEDYKMKFGTPAPGSTIGLYSFYGVKGLFDNANPYPFTLYCVRPSTSGGIAASLTVGTSGNTTTFTAAWQGNVSVGSGGNNIKIQIVQDGSNFDVNIYEYDPVSGNNYLKEQYINVNNSTIVQTINVVNQSNYVMVSSAGTGGLQVIQQPTALSGGVDPAEPTEAQVAASLPLLNNYSVQFIGSLNVVCNGTSAGAWATDLLSYTNGRYTSLGILAAPSSTNANNVGQNFSNALTGYMVFGAAYFNWYNVQDIYNNIQLIPPIGHIIGAYYIKKKNLDGYIAHSAPAGVLSNIQGITSLQYNLDLPTVESLVHNQYVNATMFVNGYGYIVRTSRSLSNSDLYYSISRLTSLMYIIESVQNTMIVFEQTPNSPETRSKAKSTIDSFLLDQYTKGMFNKDGGVSQAYLVVCDTTNNTALIQANRWLMVDITLKFAEVIEAIVISLKPVAIGYNISISS